MHTEFWLESLNRRDYLEDVGVYRIFVLKWILGKYSFENVDWIYLAHDRDHWGVLVYSTINPQFS
jgi:hypothetical protein